MIVMNHNKKAAEAVPKDDPWAWHGDCSESRGKQARRKIAGEEEKTKKNKGTGNKEEG